MISILEMVLCTRTLVGGEIFRTEHNGLSVQYGLEKKIPGREERVY